MNKNYKPFFTSSILVIIGVVSFECWGFCMVLEQKESCIVNTRYYPIMQTGITENWAAYFKTTQTLDQDSVDLCFVDSMFQVVAKEYNDGLKKRFESSVDAKALIDYYKIVPEEYGVQIVPYKHDNTIELLLSCLKRERIKDVDHWRKNYFGLIHERGTSHFYMTLNQTTKQLLSFTS